MSNNFKNQRGFTLVEMLVAIAVFMIVMTVAVGSLVSIVNANKKAQTIQTVMDNLNLAIENISKNMRIGTSYYCYDSSGWTNSTLTCKSGEKEVKYLSSDGLNIIFYRYSNTADIQNRNEDITQVQVMHYWGL